MTWWCRLLGCSTRASRPHGWGYAFYARCRRCGTMTKVK